MRPPRTTGHDTGVIRRHLRGATTSAGSTGATRGTRPGDAHRKFSGWPYRGRTGPLHPGLCTRTRTEMAAMDDRQHDHDRGLELDLPTLMTRRRVLQVLGGAGIGAGLLAVAGCGSSSSSGTTATTVG